MPRSFLALVKGLLLVESVALELDPEFNFFDELQAMAAQVSLHAAEEELPRVLEDYTELIRDFQTFCACSRDEPPGR